MSMILFRWCDCHAFLCAMCNNSFEYVAYPFYVSAIKILKKMQLHITPCEEACSPIKARSHGVIFPECDCIL